MNLSELTNAVLQGMQVSKTQALFLSQQPLAALCESADRIRRHFCANRFDICTIINAKSGSCPEDCKFCAQSAWSQTHVPCYPLLPKEAISAHARRSCAQGILRCSIVASGKRLSDCEVDEMCAAVRAIKEETGISVCVSFGLLNETQFRKLKQAGVTRVHNNLETSRRHFPNICTTHRFADKVKAIRAAQAAGLPVCSGGIMGLGETDEDRIDLALSLRALGVRSIPLNLLNPIPGTPFAHYPRLTEQEMRRIVALFRFILPSAWIRLAGGRGLLPDRGKSCFLSGANAAISGDMLTTAGITTQADMALLRALGFQAGSCDG